MNKYIYLIVFSFALSGCYYNPQSGCLHLPQSVHCSMKNIKSDVQRFYKANDQPISEEQKINDIKACGAIPNEYGYFWSAIRKAHPKDGGFAAAKKIGECMTVKGYDYDDVYN